MGNHNTILDLSAHLKNIAPTSLNRQTYLIKGGQHCTYVYTPTTKGLSQKTRQGSVEFICKEFIYG